MKCAEMVNFKPPFIPINNQGNKDIRNTFPYPCSWMGSIIGGTMNYYFGKISEGAGLYRLMSLWKLPVLVGAIVVSLIIGAGVSLADEDGRQLSGEELQKLLPGKTLTGQGRNGEWIWELHDKGKGYQIWDNGSNHYMTWSVEGDRLCYIFSAGRKAGKEQCRKVIVYGKGKYALKNRKGNLSRFSIK